MLPKQRIWETLSHFRNGLAVLLIISQDMSEQDVTQIQVRSLKVVAAWNFICTRTDMIVTGYYMFWHQNPSKPSIRYHTLAISSKTIQNLVRWQETLNCAVRSIHPHRPRLYITRKYTILCTSSLHLATKWPWDEVVESRNSRHPGGVEKFWRWASLFFWVADSRTASKADSTSSKCPESGSEASWSDSAVHQWKIQCCPTHSFPTQPVPRLQQESVYIYIYINTYICFCIYIWTRRAANVSISQHALEVGARTEKGGKKSGGQDRSSLQWMTPRGGKD